MKEVSGVRKIGGGWRKRIKWWNEVKLPWGIKENIHPLVAGKEGELWEKYIRGRVKKWRGRFVSKNRGGLGRKYVIFLREREVVLEGNE